MMKTLSPPTPLCTLLAAVAMAGALLVGCGGRDGEQRLRAETFQTDISRSLAEAALAQDKAAAAAQRAREARVDLARADGHSNPVLSVSSDAAITSALRTRLQRQELLRTAPIQVQTLHGVVWLRGQVPTHAARADAESLALATEGVRAVRNRLDVMQR